MTLLPRSRASSQQRGFTLIELLVVLAILALAVAVTGPRLLGMLTPDPARDLPQQLQDKIDRMRSDAIFKSQVEFAVIDYVDNSLTVDGVPWLPPSGWEFTPPREGDLPVDEPSPALPDPDRIGLEFAPDGTAKSAHFILHSTKDENGWIFDVSGMTGRLSYRPLHPETAG
ncbi:MAG: prepilin-type N-terminal cleavage/methylation domain-containing protein [Burkholderiales bacterium]|nr:prepilin-type N-terminal cleavage/methylation domain-containing protein [Burkholderiales bacterium]